MHRKALHERAYGATEVTTGMRYDIETMTSNRGVNRLMNSRMSMVPVLFSQMLKLPRGLAAGRVDHTSLGKSESVPSAIPYQKKPSIIDTTCFPNTFQSRTSDGIGFRFNHRLCCLPFAYLATTRKGLLPRVLLVMLLPVASVGCCCESPSRHSSTVSSMVATMFLSAATAFPWTVTSSDEELVAASRTEDDRGVATSTSASCIDLFASRGKHSSDAAIEVHRSIGSIDDD